MFLPWLRNLNILLVARQQGASLSRRNSDETVMPNVATYPAFHATPEANVQLEQSSDEKLNNPLIFGNLSRLIYTV